MKLKKKTFVVENPPPHFGGKCSPNFLILEGIKDWKGFYSEIIKDPIQWKDGYVIPPDKTWFGS